MYGTHHTSSLCVSKWVRAHAQQTSAMHALFAIVIMMESTPTSQRPNGNYLRSDGRLFAPCHPHSARKESARLKCYLRSRAKSAHRPTHPPTHPLTTSKDAQHQEMPVCTITKRMSNHVQYYYYGILQHYCCTYDELDKNKIPPLPMICCMHAYSCTVHLVRQSQYEVRR